jgi:hypothetical protein
LINIGNVIQVQYYIWTSWIYLDVLPVSTESGRKRILKQGNFLKLKFHTLSAMYSNVIVNTLFLFRNVKNATFQRIKLWPMPIILATQEAEIRRTLV